MTERVGILFSRADNLELVHLAEQLGYESIWAAEGQGQTAFGKLERWATATDDIELATGIVNIFSRSPAALAQSIATLDAHSNGRAILGLGVAHPGVVEDFHGIEFEQPLARMAEYIELVRRYLSGTHGEFDGDFFTPTRTRFWDDFSPERTEIPIYNAAIGSQNIQLTGELADGWYPNLFPMGKLNQAIEWLSEGVKNAERELSDINIAMNLPTVVDEDPGAAKQAIAEYVATYYRGDIPGFYDRVAREAGFDDEIERVAEADSLQDAADAISDDLIDLIAIAGDPTDVQNRIDDLRKAGVDIPVIRPPTNISNDQVQQTIETLAPE